MSTLYMVVKKLENCCAIFSYFVLNIDHFRNLKKYQFPMFLELHGRNPPASFHKIYIIPELKGHSVR